jgi:hypothetical protein
MASIKIKPHSLEPGALEATENTLKALRGGGKFARTPDDLYEMDGDGFLTLECEDAGFCLFAVVHQGYVAQAKEV